MRLIAHKTHPDATIPKCAHNNSAGLDITCIEKTIIPPKGSAIVPNGLRLTIKDGNNYYMQINLRSSKGFKQELICHPGIVDPGYTGDLGIKIYNLGETPVTIEKGEKYAQITILHLLAPHFCIKELGKEDWEEFKSTQNRGDGGFGSTGF